jgi:exodeoxyribonuclease VII large subunit
MSNFYDHKIKAVMYQGQRQKSILYFSKKWYKLDVWLSNGYSFLMGNLLAYPDTPLPLTITQISGYLKQHLEKGFSAVCVQGEISGCKQHTSGHTYFALKDDQCVMDAICWRGTKLQTPLHDGAMVICRGRITTYGARSKYQLIIESAEPAGQGALLYLIEQLKVQLTKEGLFQLERKKPLPRFPGCIGLITSPTGAVIQDMLVRFSDRLPCRLLLFPVAVQGSNAVPDILKALAFFHQHHPRPDVLIIARGGGSIEDLWAFYDESVVRAVAASEIPIISAIGHETDTTLMDYAADCRAPTPTAAAEMVLPLISDLQDHIHSCMTLLRRALYHEYSLGQTRLDHLTYRLQSMKLAPLPAEQRLDDFFDGLMKCISLFIHEKEYLWKLIGQKLGQGPIRDIASHQNHIIRLGQHVTRLMAEKMHMLDSLLGSYDRLLAQLSYQKTLERGFSLVLDGDEKLCSSRGMAVNTEALSIQFYDGRVLVSVNKNSA